MNIAVGLSRNFYFYGDGVLRKSLGLSNRNVLFLRMTGRCLILFSSGHYLRDIDELLSRD